MKTNTAALPYQLIGACRLTRGRLRGALAFVLCATLSGSALGHANGHHHDHDHHHDHEHADGEADGVLAAAPSSPAAGAISAAVIAENQLSLTEVFSQDSIRQSPANPFDSGVRIDFNDVIEIDRPDLLNIETRQEQEALFNLFGSGIANPSSDTLNVYYVDSIDACGATTNPLIVGCASVNGNDFIVESSFAASSQGAELLAHEISHNLGLPHVGNNGSRDNLLNPQLNGNTTLTSAQAATLISNQRVNFDTAAGELFVTINPIVIGSLFVANQAVPEPGAAALAAVGLLLMTRGRRRG